jgi:excisionase family DNA binding protein
MELMTIQEAARELRVSAITVRRHVAAGRLPAVRVGRSIRIDRRQIERFAAPVADSAHRAEPPIGEGMVLTPESPLWGIIGIIHDGPSDLAENHDAYLAEVYSDLHDR